MKTVVQQGRFVASDAIEVPQDQTKTCVFSTSSVSKPLMYSCGFNPCIAIIISGKLGNNNEFVSLQHYSGNDEAVGVFQVDGIIENLLYEIEDQLGGFETNITITNLGLFYVIDRSEPDDGCLGTSMEQEALSSLLKNPRELNAIVTRVNEGIKPSIIILENNYHFFEVNETINEDDSIDVFIQTNHKGELIISHCLSSQSDIAINSFSEDLSTLGVFSALPHSKKIKFENIPKMRHKQNMNFNRENQENLEQIHRLL